MEDRLTEKQYWDSTYQTRGSLEPAQVEGAGNLWAARILEVMDAYVNDANSVLEIGGGGSAWLAYFASMNPEKKFTSLDYSTEGGELLKDFAERRSLDNISVVVEDFFSPSDGLEPFDLVYSLGVVEHFQNLPEVLRAHAGFVAEDGRMFTMIPNMAGSLGTLTRWMDPAVYDIHVPHTLETFVQGHRDAGLEIVDAGYLGSTNFGVLSSCVGEERGLKYFTYRQLSRFSRLAWHFEQKVFRLPTTRLLSPYIFVVSKKGA